MVTGKRDPANNCCSHVTVMAGPCRSPVTASHTQEIVYSAREPRGGVRMRESASKHGHQGSMLRGTGGNAGTGHCK